MEAILLGMVIVESDEHPAKTYAGNECMPVPSVILSRDEQSQKASSPNDTTEFGTVNSLSAEQL